MKLTYMYMYMCIQSSTIAKAVVCVHLAFLLTFVFTEMKGTAQEKIKTAFNRFVTSTKVSVMEYSIAYMYTWKAH